MMYKGYVLRSGLFSLNLLHIQRMKAVMKQLAVFMHRRSGTHYQGQIHQAPSVTHLKRNS